MKTFNVRIEQTGDEFECGEDETVLEAAFRNGYHLASGCREGRCSACKAYILEGYADHKAHSTFALSEFEEEDGFALLCRAMPETDLSVELMTFDPETYRLDRPIVEGEGRIAAIDPVTHDITTLVLDIERPSEFGFKAGQYLDLWTPDGAQKRSYSMSNLPEDGRLEFIIKRYPGGLFSGLLDGRLSVGDALRFTGPYGNCCLRDSSRSRRQLLIAGGSGMGPVLSLLREISRDPDGARTVRFFYGGRAQRDLFHADLIEELGSRVADFEYVPVLSDLADDDSWPGERGFVHEAVGRWLEGSSVADDGEWEVYMAGPQVMVDATRDLLAAGRWVDPSLVFYDAFTDTGAVDEDEER